MKNIILLILVSIFIFSCQTEESEIIQDNNENLTASSPLLSLVGRVSQNATSQDNVLDNSSCFAVQLPVVVIVNNQQITVSTSTDYQIVQDAIDAFSNDDDIVNFNYPITIVYQNFSTQVILNSNAFDDVLDDCGEDDDFDEIDCISINYPIVINVYNSNNQLANTVTILNDVQLYNFIENLDSSDLIAINYPISLQNSNGQTIVIDSNNELENFIEDAIDDCDNSSGGSGGTTTLANIITNGTWYISYYFDDVDETSNYNGYNFTFNSNGTSIAIKNSTSINGTWSNYIDSGQEKLELVFDGLTLDELEDDWRIIEFSSNIIKLKDVSGGNGGTDYLYFTKN
ncbi:hypothetical protein ACFO3U_06365 [Flavobacterium ponti]|uniref:Lipocalin-like domain-containing protein n=1 Tax=Flavobacterium ponti TaxID=665133 RepID=A0ABV9P5V1_9FLAO